MRSSRVLGAGKRRQAEGLSAEASLTAAAEVVVVDDSKHQHSDRWSHWGTNRKRFAADGRVHPDYHLSSQENLRRSSAGALPTDST